MVNNILAATDAIPSACILHPAAREGKTQLARKFRDGLTNSENISLFTSDFGTLQTVPVKI